MQQAVARLVPRWEAELADVEFAVEEVPAAQAPDGDPEPVPMARLEPASPASAASPGAPASSGHGTAGRAPARARIVLYRRPLLARADGEEELEELILDVVIEKFARLLGLDPEIVDPGYGSD